MPAVLATSRVDDRVQRLAAVTRREGWLSLPEPAEYLGLAMRTMSNLVGRGRIRSTGWPMRIAWSELEAFVRRSRLEPGSLRHLYAPSVEGEDS
jgi:hypothetical protein